MPSPTHARTTRDGDTVAVLATWVRRCGLPFAILAWTGVALLLLWLAGQVLLCGLLGLMVGVGMAIIGVPYALLLGVLAFVLGFIPVLGMLISGALRVLLAVPQGWLIAVIVLVYFVVVHVIESDIVGPRIVGHSIGLHPVVSLAALIAGAELFGIGGALFASPVAGVIQALLVAIWLEWRATHPHQFQSPQDDNAEAGASLMDTPRDSELTPTLLT